jgi:hypothetical protein
MSRVDFVEYLDELLWPGLAATGIDRLDQPVDQTHIARLLAEVPPVEDDTPPG